MRVVLDFGKEDKNTEVKFTLFGTDWTANIGANQVKTFIVSDGKVKETDFLEETV